MPPNVIGIYVGLYIIWEDPTVPRSAECSLCPEDAQKTKMETSTRSPGPDVETPLSKKDIVSTYIRTYIHTYIHTDHICIHTYLCIHIYIHAYMCIYVCMCVYICIHLLTYLCILYAVYCILSIFVFIHFVLCKCSSGYSYVHRHSHRQIIYIHTHVHIYIYTRAYFIVWYGMYICIYTQII